MYTCKKCGAPIEMSPENKIIRPYCNHEGEAVLVNMVATVYGTGDMQKMLVKNPEK